jgi:hypothetical protein
MLAANCQSSANCNSARCSSSSSSSSNNNNNNNGACPFYWTLPARTMFSLQCTLSSSTSISRFAACKLPRNVLK